MSGFPSGSPADRKVSGADDRPVFVADVLGSGGGAPIHGPSIRTPCESHCGNLHWERQRQQRAAILGDDAVETDSAGDDGGVGVGLKTVDAEDSGERGRRGSTARKPERRERPQGSRPC